MVLVPSLYEGWGLPVVEALRHRRPVIASNRGAIAEAGFGVAVHLDPEDRWAWCAAISGMALAPRAYSPPVALPSWSEAGRAVSAVLGEVAIQSVCNSGAQDRYGFRLAMWTRKWSATAAKMVRRWSGRIKPWPA